MQVQKIHNNINNSQAINELKQPNFKALYFATPKIQQKCTKHPRFAKFLNSQVIKEVVDKYNIVITNVFTKILKGKGFNFRACTDVMLNGDKIEAAGMKSPVLSFDKSYKFNHFQKDNDDLALVGLSQVGVKDATLKLLSREKMFDKLFFVNDKEKEKFQSNIFSQVFFDIKGVEDSIKRYNVIIHSGNPLKFSVATDIVQRGDEIQPAGLATRIFKVDSRNYSKDMYSELGGYIDTLLKMTKQDVPSKNNYDDSF